MSIKSKVFIQTLNKTQDSHNISFSFDFNNKKTKKSSGQIAPRMIYPPSWLGLNFYMIPPNTINPLKHGRFSDPFFKVLWEGGKTKFLDSFFHEGIRNKKVCKVKNFQVWVSHTKTGKQSLSYFLWSCPGSRIRAVGRQRSRRHSPSRSRKRVVPTFKVWDFGISILT